VLSFHAFNVQAFRPSIVAVRRHFWIDRHAKLLHDDIHETGLAPSENQSFGIVGVLMFGSLSENRIHELHLRLIDPT